ncbi:MULTISPECIES: hypothetical protein [unclassified Oleiphilus]|uniref:hypothetical protein n=1 Tax=unclassified Oleiphilus TaxID=2631174 RepID=UPI000B131739|nr:MULTISPECIES: hypothetical protein [unclassified Oleiphilus]
MGNTSVQAARGFGSSEDWVEESAVNLLYANAVAATFGSLAVLLLIAFSVSDYIDSLIR